ncbi:DMT family transporter [Algiphilus sp.]|uniref:DMT family transporter n=1 Tax=Algiphilus sp. TaxID=1872431 RepID=UPI003C5175EF
MESATTRADSVARRTHVHGLVLAIVGAVFFSAKAILAKLLYREGIDAVTLVALRMLLSVPFFALVAAWTWMPRPRPSAADAGRIALLGLLGYYASSMLDFWGLQYITAGLERLILFLTPTFVLLLGMLFLGRRVTGLQWLSMGFAYAGIVLVFQHDLALGGDDVALGAGLVFAAACTYAVYLLLSGEIVARVGTLRLVSLAMIACCVASVVQYAVLRPLPGLFEQTAAVWGLSLLNATLCTVLPVFLIMFAIARIGAGVAAQAGMVGPVSTLFLAWWVLEEPFSAVQIGGTALVLVGILLLSVRRAG